jgi:hypothetical protein
MGESKQSEWPILSSIASDSSALLRGKLRQLQQDVLQPEVAPPILDGGSQKRRSLEDAGEYGISGTLLRPALGVTPHARCRRQGLKLEGMRLWKDARHALIVDRSPPPAKLGHPHGAIAVAVTCVRRPVAIRHYAQTLGCQVKRAYSRRVGRDTAMLQTRVLAPVLVQNMCSIRDHAERKVHRINGLACAA